MKRKIDRDLLSGLLFVGFGAWVVAYAWMKYSLGTVSNMDSGYFPVMLGGLLVLVGLIVIAITFVKKTEVLEFSIRPRPLIAVLGSILFFALTIERFGMFPAVMGMTLLAAAAEKPYMLGRTIFLGIFLGGLGWLVFVAGLGMNLVAFNIKGL